MKNTGGIRHPIRIFAPRCTAASNADVNVN